MGGGLADGVSGALAVGGIKERNGYIENLLDGRKAGNRNALSYRAQLQIEPASRASQIRRRRRPLQSDERGNYGDALTDSFRRGSATPACAGPQRDRLQPHPEGPAPDLRRGFRRGHCRPAAAAPS